ncbi:hypothetical protein BDQ17DRAFT_1331518 [Cyathus striatus]|nr:hypothetical protein BDQ17DRAFT_1331518 [Cyathus striatus]
MDKGDTSESASSSFKNDNETQINESENVVLIESKDTHSEGENDLIDASLDDEFDESDFEEGGGNSAKPIKKTSEEDLKTEDEPTGDVSQDEKKDDTKDDEADEVFDFGRNRAPPKRPAVGGVIKLKPKPK